MTPDLYIVLPPSAVDLAAKVRSAGAIPVIDVTTEPDVVIPEGVIARARSGRVPRGGGAVWVTGGDPIPGRDTFLETTDPGPVPAGFAGVVLRGREAGGRGADVDGLALLAAAADPGRVWLDAGLGPRSVGAAAALGAGGVVVSDAILGLPELRLPPALAQRLARPGHELVRRVGGFSVANAATAPVLRRLVAGEDPYDLARDLWRTADPGASLWPAGQGLVLARRLAETHRTLEGLVAAYLDGLRGFRARAALAVRVDPDSEPAVTPWEVALDEGRAIAGPVVAAVATGGRVAASEAEFDRARRALLPDTAPEPLPADAIAIIGLGCRLPDASTAEAFWRNVTEGRSSIREVPHDRWDPALYWDPDHAVPDKTYAKIGAFVEDRFEPKRFRIPPRVAAQMDPVQRLALDAAADALVDAGLRLDAKSDRGRAFDRSRCAVLLGNALGGETKDRSALRIALPALERAVDSVDVEPAARDLVKGALGALVHDSRPIDEDAMPGELSNVISGRIANSLDLSGPNYTLDAACASSLAAVQTAIKGLLDHDFDLALSGGADRSMDPATYVKFAKIGALSADRSTPYDAGANGFVMGEGAAVLVLKRYSDALRDGDRIYAVIRGVGASSDGRGKGITAPSKAGQLLALRRAYEAAGVEPGDVDLVEGHGTGTVVGDQVEVEALAEVLGSRGARGPVRLGSVKSMIGHLKAAAGAAALLKTALALHHRVFPPSLGFQSAPSAMPLDRVPLRVQTAAEPWPDSGRPRRAGVSAFGFGGTNFHVVLEEAAGAPGRVSVPRLPPGLLSPASTPPPARPAAPPSPRLPPGVWAASAPDRDTLARRLEDLRDGRTAAFAPTDNWRAAGGALNAEIREEQLTRAIVALKAGTNVDLLRSRGVFVESARVTGKVAFLFPGQGSQHVGMALDLAARHDVVADTLRVADGRLVGVLGRPLTELLRGGGPDAEAVLTRTEHAQPAVFAHDVALDRLLRAHGLSPDAVAGHSLGEYAAAVSAGVLSFEDGLYAVSARGREMAGIVLEDPGAMAGVAADPSRVDAVLAGIDGYVVAANRNCPTQTVIAGETAAVRAATEAFRAEGVDVVPLAVSHAFHSRVVAPATEPLRAVLGKLDVRAPHTPITSNVDAAPYDADPARIVDRLARQIAAPVRWNEQIERLYADGVRVFVEVGPKRALTGFTKAILGDRPHVAVATNHPKRGGPASFLDALAALVAAGISFGDPPADGEIDMSELEEAARRAGADPALADRVLPAVQDLLRAVVSATRAAPAPAAAPPPIEVVASGAALGLPGGDEVFGADNARSILAGQNRISNLGDRAQVFLGLGITRLVKDAATGAGSFHRVEDLGDVIRLAGSASRFDPRDYGLPDELVDALDRTSMLAIAAGLEALRDAGIPLVRDFRDTAGGKRVAGGWKLPPSLRDRTGVVFASAFPGYDRLLEKVASNGQDAEGRFDRRLLFQILSMGHSQLAQLIGARGPNTQVNAACASTTQAITVAEDWIRAGRCDRVLVVGADDVTTDRLLPWIGGGFLAAGAATTADRVEDGALPFDRRRHGLILGMGAVGVVLERRDVCRARGTAPLGRLLASRLSNSAFHGTRLDAEHIATELAAVVEAGAASAGTSVAEMARQTVFFSHETYTPARGGSASAEAAALRRAFGPAAKDVVIANTKGFTGHPMGAGIEDAIALKALQYGEVPPIPNLKELDPDFSDLTLSSGGPRACRFAVRLAAGFGSQVALTVWEREAVGDERVVDARARDAWLRQVTGFADAALVVEDRTLRAIEGDPVAAAAPAPAAPTPAPASPRATSTPAPAVDRPASAPRAPRGLPPGVDVLDVLLDVVSAHTGYARSELDPDFELEADLGVDTVKQAEILSSLRERLDLARDDGFRLADHPTLRALAGWADARLRVIAPLDATLADEPTEHRPPPSFSSSQVATVPPAPRASDVPTGPPASPRVVEPTVTSATPDPGATTERPGPERLSAPVRPRHDVYGLLAEIVATHTGYAVTDLDPEFELEADLGVDTVKQAEILSEARKQLGLGPLDLRLADHPSLGALAAFLAGRLSEPAHPALADVPEAVEPPPDVSPQPVEDDGPPSGVALRVPVTAPIGEARGAPLHGRAVKVLGWGPVADAIRRRLLERGAVEHEPADLVVDAGLDADGLLVEAQLRADAPPARWICVVAQGDDLIQAGARAGFTKALGREWTTTEVRVVDLRGGADEIARLVAIEASAPGPVEVRYEGGVRRGVRYAVVPAPEPGDAEGKVVVITGGARGVGAEIAAELARRGARLALVGRTAPSEAPFDEEAERERVRAQLSARGKRVTPVQVEARLAPLRAAGEVRAALDRLPGSTYHVADLGDPTRVPALVEEIRAAHGRIDALIHGAGFEDSRALADKRSDAVSTALAPKALALDALLTALPEVRALAMGSVAGRFGNAGQVDYAAANDAMARRTLAHPRGLSVAWTAWGDVGMATRGSLPRLLEERGVELLRATDGARIAADLLLSDVTGEVVVAGRLGPFTHATGHPMVRSVRLDGPSVSAELPLDLASAPWLEDHAIDGTPVLPGVVGLEWMAAVATELGGEAPIAARDVRFRTPLKVHPGSTPVVRVVAWDDDGPVARLSSTRTLANGREQTVHHFQARFDAVLSTEALPSAFLPDEALDFDAIYQRFFHGPAFRVLARVDGLASDGLVATARVPPGGLPDGLGFAPLVIEAAFQAAGLLHLATTGNDALPAGIALVEILGAATPDDDLTVTVAAAGGRYDVDVDGSGGPVVRLRGLVLAERGPAAPDRRLDAGPGGRPPGFEGYGGVTAGPRFAVATAPEIAGWRLSRATLDAIDARGTPPRRRDRRVGRVAVGRALSAVGAPGDVENDVAGRPIAVGASVSLSHRDGRAVAVAARGPVGIDLERIEVRSGAFLEDWLTDAERARVGADPVRQTAVWSTKESVLKLLGAGLALDARDVDVEVGAPGATRVTLRGEARARWQAAGAAPIAAYWRRLDADYVVTVATSEPDQTLRR